jgi:hypothetical protein
LYGVDGNDVHDRVLIGPRGSVLYPKDGRHLVMLVNGEIRTYGLTIRDVVEGASEYMGRNLRAEDWIQELPDEPYQRIFPEYPIHVSQIDYLLRTGEKEMRAGNEVNARAAFSEAVKGAMDARSVSACRFIVESGIRQGLADVVLIAAEYAVKLLPKDTWVHDTPAKARAAAKNSVGANDDVSAARGD